MKLKKNDEKSCGVDFNSSIGILVILVIFISILYVSKLMNLE